MNFRIIIKKNSLCWSCMATLFLQGCAGLDAYNDSFYPTSYKTVRDELTEEERTDIHQVRIVVIDSAFDTQFKGVYTGGKFAGATECALAGGIYGSLASLEFPPAIIVFAPVGIVVGGIYGVSTCESKDEIESLITTTGQACRDSGAQEYLIQSICLVTGRYKSDLNSTNSSDQMTKKIYLEPPFTPPQSADSTLEITLTQIGTRRANYDPSLFSHDVVDVVISTRVKLVRIHDASTVFEGDYFYRSRASHAKEFEEWTRNNAAPLRAEIRLGIATISRAVIQDILSVPEPVPALPDPTENRSENAYSQTHI